jgi:hypothetical protein
VETKTAPQRDWKKSKNCPNSIKIMDDERYLQNKHPVFGPTVRRCGAKQRKKCQDVDANS